MNNPQWLDQNPLLVSGRVETTDPSAVVELLRQSLSPEVRAKSETETWLREVQEAMVREQEGWAKTRAIMSQSLAEIAEMSAKDVKLEESAQPPSILALLLAYAKNGFNRLRKNL